MTHRTILRLAIPSIIANITAPLMAMVDTAIVGHIGSAIYIAAIAVGGSLFNLLYWGFAFLRMGTSGMTAQAYGAGDAREQRVILQRSLFVAVGIGLVMIMLQRPLIHLIMRFMEIKLKQFAEMRKFIFPILKSLLIINNVLLMSFY